MSRLATLTVEYLLGVGRLRCLVVALAVAVPVGLLGASAFNPDSGFVLHNEALWRIFGIMFELGLPLLFIVAILTAVVHMLSRRRSRNA